MLPHPRYSTEHFTSPYFTLPGCFSQPLCHGPCPDLQYYRYPLAHPHICYSLHVRSTIGHCPEDLKHGFKNKIKIKMLPKCCHGVYKPRHRCGRLKTKPRNVSPAQEFKITHLGCGIAMRSMWSCQNRIRLLTNLSTEVRMQGKCRCGVEGYG